MWVKYLYIRSSFWTIMLGYSRLVIKFALVNFHLAAQGSPLECYVDPTKTGTKIEISNLHHVLEVVSNDELPKENVILIGVFNAILENHYLKTIRPHLTQAI